MRSLLRPRRAWQLLALAVISFATRPAASADPPSDPSQVADAAAKTEAEMKPYTDVIANSDAGFDMVPIPGGKFMMGSPAGEKGRKADEWPQSRSRNLAVLDGQVRSHLGRVRRVEPWRWTCSGARCERSQPTSWDRQSRRPGHPPTKPYADMTFGMGKQGYPAICMTQFAAKMYCKWL